MKKTNAPASRRAIALRGLTRCTGALVLAMATGCSAAGDGDLPANGTGTSEAARPGAASAKRLDPAATPFFDGEDSLNLVAQVGLEGRVIKFFEPEEGTLLEIEMIIEGAVTSDPNESGLSGSALYSYLTKSEAPTALLEAEWRVQEVAARNGTEVKTEIKNSTDVDGVAAEVNRAETPARGLPGLQPKAEWDEAWPPPVMDDNFFMNKYCTPTDRFWECGGLPGWWCVGNSRWEGSGVNMVQSGARSIEGTHKLSMKFGIETAFDITLRPGTAYGWRRTSGTNKSPYSKVIHGGTGGYRHCVNFHY